ncbi:MAG: hypothetical protein CMG57_05485 [Candidatus Marinimicrobia bacterium]|nr:hypothetical protein [Candidatus Neomarinimicrobiota bacterium]
MILQDKIRKHILSKTVSTNNRTIGMEEECILYTNDGRRLPVNPCDEFSAIDLIQIMNEQIGNNGLYTLEPGGQLEWSSPPFKDLNHLYASLKKHKELLGNIIETYSLDIVSFGIEPNYSPEDIDLINQLKYQLMDTNMERNGTMGKWMMRNSASIQINFDIVNEKDLEEMVFVADCLHPICAYIFSNSPRQRGKTVGVKNLRNIVWENTDSLRCRNLIDHGINCPEQLLDQFIDYMLMVPGIFQLDAVGDIVATDQTLGSRLQKLEQSGKIRDEDIKTALHQIFTNVRLKDLVEVRGSDRTPIGYEMAPVAFWTGILTVNSVRDQILSVVKNWTIEERNDFNKAALILDDEQIGPNGDTYREWNMWAGDLAIEGLQERGLREERFFNEFFSIVKSQGPFSLQSQ